MTGDKNPGEILRIIEGMAQELAEKMKEDDRTAIPVYLGDDMYIVTLEGPVVLKKRQPNTLENYIQEGWK